MKNAIATPVHIMIISGEASGELYGSLLATELFHRFPRLSITGVGGERMNKAGVKLIAGISGAMGFTEALSSVRQLLKTYKLIKEMFLTNRPDLIVLIDFPDFNLKVAKTAKAMGIKVLFYVSPQVWLWRKGRVKKIARLCDRIAVILPFEEEIYKNANLPCKFVGHPVMEEIESLDLNPDTLKKEFNLLPNRPVCAILPGSRHSELDKHLPILAQTFDILKGRHPQLQFIMPLATSLNLNDNESKIINDLKQSGVIMIVGRAVEVLSVSNIALVASGTATLQTALMGVPMVIFYKVSSVSFFIGSFLIQLKLFGLPNILAGKKIVPELMQDNMRTHELVKAFDEIYNNTAIKEAMSSSLINIREMFKGKRPSYETASIVTDILNDGQMK